MDSLKDMIEATDNVWAAIALFFGGIYVLLWKYGGELIRTVRSTEKTVEHARDEAVQANVEAKQIANAIVTNHGSANIGDALDRLTTLTMNIHSNQRDGTELLNQIRREFVLHLADSEDIKQRVSVTLAEVLDRLDKIDEDHKG